MTMPYYASPEQLMRDRSEYARKGISRGRSVAVLTYADGVLFIAENPSSTLHKVGELYDRIGFAAVGRYSEFESLRVAGVRLADVRGYSYNRRDVTGRVIANAYAQTLGEIFTRADEAVRGRALRRRGRRQPRERPALPAHLRRLDRRRARLRRHGRPGRGGHRPPARALPLRHGPVRRARRSASGPCPQSARSPPAPATAGRPADGRAARGRRPRPAPSQAGLPPDHRLGPAHPARRRGRPPTPPRTRPAPPRTRRACPSPAPRPAWATRPTPTPPAAPSTRGPTRRTDACRPTGSTRTPSRRRAS